MKQTSPRMERPWDLMERTALGAIAGGWVDLAKSCAYSHGVELTESRVTRVADGWRVMLKGVRSGRPLVAFVNADTYTKAIDYAGYWAHSGLFVWYPDRYPVKE